MRTVIKSIIFATIILGVGSIWVSERSVNTNAQTAAISVPRGYQISTGWFILDGSNATTTKKLTFMDSYGQNLAAWGSFTMWTVVEALKGGSATDSMQYWYKELPADTSITSYYDSTSITSNFNWDDGKWKRYSISPALCYGLEFRVKHVTTVDDCVKVKINLVYQ